MWHQSLRHTLALVRHACGHRKLAQAVRWQQPRAACIGRLVMGHARVFLKHTRLNRRLPHAVAQHGPSRGRHDCGLCCAAATLRWRRPPPTQQSRSWARGCRSVCSNRAWRLLAPPDTRNPARALELSTASVAGSPRRPWHGLPGRRLQRLQQRRPAGDGQPAARRRRLPPAAGGDPRPRGGRLRARWARPAAWQPQLNAAAGLELALSAAH